MKKHPLSRREFLRLSMIAAGSAVATACQSSPTLPVEISTAAPSPTPPVKFSLPGANVDAWTWVKQVKVGVSEGECEKVILRVNGQEVDARPKADAFAAEVQLAEGENQMRAACVLPEGGEVQSEPVIYTGRLRQSPAAVTQITLREGEIHLDGSESLTAQDGSPIVEYVWSPREGNPSRLRALDGEVKGATISILPATKDGEYYARLKVKDEAGREDTSTIYFVVENGQPRIPDYDKENPAWLETAVVYGVVPFLFGSPAFQALSDHLADLADLGVNAIWLGPINSHPEDDYGYAVEDYFSLHPAYGTEEDFRNLVQTAHRLGIRVLMDFVPNHTSNSHPYFRDTLRLGPESNYWDFYNRDAEGNYTYYFDWSHLPNLNYDNPEVQRMMIEAFSKWVREFDVDGFRVDVAWGIRERQPGFWPEWRRALKRIKPDLMLLAAATAREPYYFDNGFDVAYDWSYQPGSWAWRAVWDSDGFQLLSHNLTDALLNRPEGFHPDAVIFRFLNNNDTGERFITRHGEGITRVATALLLTVPGIPCIYTGDEYGLEFEPYQQLEPLVFEEKFPRLREYHKKLIALRKTVPSLHSRHLSILKLDAVPQTVFGYLRYDETSEAPVLVLLNFSEEPADFRFDTPAEFGVPKGRNLYDLLANESVPAVADKRIHVSAPAHTARLLTHAPVE